MIPNPKRDLRPGMFVTANVKGAMRRNAVVVPQLAVQEGPKGHVVYVEPERRRGKVPAGTRRRVLRREGHRDHRRSECRRPGGRGGMLKVVPGQPVQIAQAGAAGAPPAAASDQASPKPGDAPK